MNILIVDDHPIMLLGVEQVLLKELPEAEVTKAAGGNDVLEEIKAKQFSLCILDIVLPNTDTHALILKLLNKQPLCKVLIYSGCSDELYAMKYISLGASGFVNKFASDAELATAIRMVLAGQIYLSEKVLRSNLNNNSRTHQAGNPRHALTQRETELLNHLLQGQSNKEIGSILNIEQSTVATLKGRIMRKMGAKNMIDLVRAADENGFV